MRSRTLEHLITDLDLSDELNRNRVNVQEMSVLKIWLLPLNITNTKNDRVSKFLRGVKERKKSYT